MAEDAKKSQRQKELEEKRKKLEAIKAKANEPPAAATLKPAASAAPAPAPTAPDLKKVDNVEDLLRGLDAIPYGPHLPDFASRKQRVTLSQRAARVDIGTAAQIAPRFHRRRGVRNIVSRVSHRCLTLSSSLKPAAQAAAAPAAEAPKLTVPLTTVRVASHDIPPKVSLSSICH